MLTLTASLLLSMNSGSLAGRADVSQERYAELAAPFHAVGALGGMGTGTLVADRWVITAAHVADFLRMRGQDPIVFTLDDGREFEVDRVVIHPTWTPLEEQMANRGDDDLFTSGDLALLRLAEPVEGVEPMPLGTYEEPGDGPGGEVTLVGIGAFLNDPESGVDPREMMGMQRGVKHAGSNRVDRADRQRKELVLSFTGPDEEGATADEVSAVAGDSGGPVLSNTDAGWAVVGIIASVEDANGTMGDYGDETRATSVGAVRRWIDNQIND